MYALKELGWSDFFVTQIEQGSDGLVPARVAEENRELYRIFCEQGEFLAELSGKLRHAAMSRSSCSTRAATNRSGRTSPLRRR